MIFFKTIFAQRLQPTHDNVIVLDMILLNGPRLWTCAGLSLLSTCLALAWRLRWLWLRGGYEAHIENTSIFFGSYIYIYKWIVCWELFVVVWDIFHFHPDPWGFMIQFDEHIFHMGWFNHRIKPASLKLYFLSDTKFIFSVVPRSRSISQSQTQWQLAWHHVQVGDVSKWYRRWKKSQTITWDVSQTL